MDERPAACCFTGHRISKLPWRGDEEDARCVNLKERLAAVIEAVYSSGVRHFICGMANGCDLYFAEGVLALREARGDITLEAAVPFPGQAERWGAELCARYESILSRCDRQTLVSREYTAGCMMRRNRYMVDKASVLIACYDGTAGGTRNTMLYAIRQGVNVIQVPVE